jgi:hypothetical protein
MAGRRATLVAILSVVLVACTAGAEPSQPEGASPGSPTSGTTGGPTPTASPAMPTPSSRPTQVATPTPRPTPKRPTGMRLAADYYSCEGIVLGPEDSCDEWATGEYRITWKTPRAKGLEVRVFGVTECLSNDIYGAWIDGGWCLRQAWANDIYGVLVDGGPYTLEHTAIPPELLVPLAKAKAANGRVVFDVEDFGLDGFWDPFGAEDGTAMFAIVAAVYDTDGQRSPLTVVFSSHYCDVYEDLDCPESYDSQMGYYPIR